MSQNLENFFSVKEAALYIGIDYMALHQRIHRGTVQVERPGNHIVLVPRQEAERLKAEREADCVNH